MPRLCRMCETEGEEQECIYCGSPTVEVDELYEIKFSLRCTECNSNVVKKIDHDKPDILEMGFWETKYCPVCGDYHVHERNLVSCNVKNYDAWLDKAYRQELRR